MGGAHTALAANCKLQQNANEGCNSCASLAGPGLALKFYCKFYCRFYCSCDMRLIDVTRQYVVVNRLRAPRVQNRPNFCTYVLCSFPVQRFSYCNCMLGGITANLI